MNIRMSLLNMTNTRYTHGCFDILASKTCANGTVAITALNCLDMLIDFEVHVWVWPGQGTNNHLIIISLNYFNTVCSHI